MAQRSCSASRAGWQVKIFRRLAESFGGLDVVRPGDLDRLDVDVAVALLFTAGAGGRTNSSSGLQRLAGIANAITRVPAFAGKRTCRSRIAVERVLLPLGRPEVVLRVPLDGRNTLHQAGLSKHLDALAVDAHLDRLRLAAQTSDVFVLRPLQPDLDHVVAVERKGVA